ncbi:MAG: type VI secretion system contractile sheath small subunit [Pseudomonadota bacterium]
MVSVHNKLEKVRKPRVHIKYEVETEGALVEKELPFVVGVLGDFSGNPTEELKPFGERKFVQIDIDNFDEVMRRMTPGLQMRVPNTLSDDESDLRVDLKFSSLDDFEPAAIVEQVPALKTLLESRNQLRDLLSKADRSEKLETLLERVLQDNDALRELVDELKSKTDQAKEGAQ